MSKPQNCNCPRIDLIFIKYNISVHFLIKYDPCTFLTGFMIFTIYDSLPAISSFFKNSIDMLTTLFVSI